jgi:hypothetical protein
MINAYKAHKILIVFQCGTKSNKRNRGKVEIFKFKINLNFHKIIFNNILALILLLKISWRNQKSILSKFKGLIVLIKKI